MVKKVLSYEQERCSRALLRAARRNVDATRMLYGRYTRVCRARHTRVCRARHTRVCRARHTRVCRAQRTRFAHANMSSTPLRQVSSYSTTTFMNTAVKDWLNEASKNGPENRAVNSSSLPYSSAMACRASGSRKVILPYPASITPSRESSPTTLVTVSRTDPTAAASSSCVA
jgi:hypothetical protein